MHMSGYASCWGSDMRSAIVARDDPGRSCHDAHDKTVAELRESAYRRGYQQGFEMALDAIQEGIQPSLLQRLRSLISDWRFRHGRYRGLRAMVVRPPELWDGKISAPARG